MARFFKKLNKNSEQIIYLAGLEYNFTDRKQQNAKNKIIHNYGVFRYFRPVGVRFSSGASIQSKFGCLYACNYE